MHQSDAGHCFWVAGTEPRAHQRPNPPLVHGGARVRPVYVATRFSGARSVGVWRFRCGSCVESCSGDGGHEARGALVRGGPLHMWGSAVDHKCRPERTRGADGRSGGQGAKAGQCKGATKAAKKA